MTSKIPVLRLDSSSADFHQALRSRLDRDMLIADDVTAVVDSILAAVRTCGDSAVMEYTQRFDQSSARDLAELTIKEDQLKYSLAAISSAQRKALITARDRIQRYHERQKQDSWQYEEEDGSIFGQQVLPLERVGIYVPGGKANYPSSMLMMAVPAAVAGVKEIVAVVPTPYPVSNREEKSARSGDNSQPDQRHLIFAAAALAGVSHVYTIGGAQAIAALAYGTESIAKVDKITGPGNVYVTAAKKKVFGEVGIDMVAGPSELTIICDGKTNPDWIAMDLFSQAEHDEQAQSILISSDGDFLNAVEQSIERLLPDMERRDIIRASMVNRGLLVQAKDIDDAVRISNLIAPEHLELSVHNPQSILDRIENAGAIFLGRHSAEALGDYCAGPSHVLPTSGTARFFSALGVYDFQKRSSLIYCSPKLASDLAQPTAELAYSEELQAHALSALYRKETDS